MRFFKSMLVSTAFLGASLSSAAFAIDLYKDARTNKIYYKSIYYSNKLSNYVRIDGSSIENAAAENNHSDLIINKKRINVQDDLLLVTDNALIKLGKDGLRFETVDGNFKIKLGGRVHADASFSSHDIFSDADGNQVEANDGAELRRGRVEFTGTFFKEWIVRNQLEFAGSEISLKDLWLRYTGLDFINITVGEQKQAFSRELQESANDMIFIERSVMNVINGAIVDRAMGLNISSQGKNWTSQIGVYGDSIATKKRKIATDEGWSASSRFTFTPIADKNKLLHLGVAGNFREPNETDVLDNTTLQLASNTTNMSNLNLIRSTITNINNIKMLGLEASVILGPFSIGGEYTNTWIDRKNGESNLYFNGWYGEAAWTLTGEQRNYENGRILRVTPTNSFSFAKGSMGAWELAVRYAEVDLKDGNFKGGNLSNLTIALNWYLNENTRLMAGYDKALRIIDSPLTNSDGSKPDNHDTFMFRAQLAF